MMTRRLAAVVPETGSTNEPEVAEGAWARSHMSMTRARTVEAYSADSASASGAGYHVVGAPPPDTGSAATQTRMRRNAAVSVKYT
jgi:hypothetical protein